jgi:Domain of unknown function (DUF4185)
MFAAGASLASLTLLWNTPLPAAEGACGQIRSACQAAGFVPGGAPAGRGLKDDCMDPILGGGSQPQNATKPLPQVDPQWVAECRAQRSNPRSNADAGVQAASDARSSLPSLTYIEGSTAKINQLVGEEDKELHKPTLSRTETRYGLIGTDLGYSFEHQGRVYFLFGDTVGVARGALDSIASVEIGGAGWDPTAGVRLDFLTVPDGRYLTIQPPGVSMGAFEVPVSGISLNGKIYVVVSTNHSEDRSTDRSVLTRMSLPATPTGFTPLRTISQRPSGKFIKMSLHILDDPIPGLPGAGPFVLMWGSGNYRHSDAYLAIVPASQFESGQNTLYFGGLDATGMPVWTQGEGAAEPIITNGTIGDLSVTWCGELGLWLMTYDSRAPARAGILFSYSHTPWGPWSSPQLIFNASRDHAIGRFIHDPQARPDDGLAGPVIGKGQNDPGAVHGGSYAPYVVEPWTRVHGKDLSIFYVLSTWNPYVVVLMQSHFQISGP